MYNTIYSCQILMEIAFSRQILENILICKISLKSVQWEPNCSTWTTREAARRDEADSRFRKCTKAPKNAQWAVYGSFTKDIANIRFLVSLYLCIRLRLRIFLIFVVLSIMLYSSEISPTRCNNCVFILRNGFTIHVSVTISPIIRSTYAVYGHRLPGSLR